MIRYPVVVSANGRSAIVVTELAGLRDDQLRKLPQTKWSVRCRVGQLDLWADIVNVQGGTSGRI